MNRMVTGACLEPSPSAPGRRHVPRMDDERISPRHDETVGRRHAFPRRGWGRSRIAVISLVRVYMPDMVSCGLRALRPFRIIRCRAWPCQHCENKKQGRPRGFACCNSYRNTVFGTRIILAGPGEKAAAFPWLTWEAPVFHPFCRGGKESLPACHNTLWICRSRD